MRTSIRTKILGGFLLVIVLAAALSLYSGAISEGFLEASVGRNSVFLAEEISKRISHDIYTKIGDLQTLSMRSHFQETLGELNSQFEKLGDVEGWIRQKEKEWSSASKGEITPLMGQLIDKELSRELREEFIELYERKHGYQCMSEILVTNRYGAVVAETEKTPRYRQDNQTWWQDAKNQGFYLAVSKAETGQPFAISVGIRVEDEIGEFMGAMKAGLIIKGIVREAEIASKQYKTTTTKLITNDGLLIYGTKAFQFMEDVSKKAFFKNIKGQEGFFVVKSKGGRQLYSYARSKDYRGLKSLGWIVVVAHNADEVLAPAIKLRDKVFLSVFGLIGLGVFIAFFISWFITGSISRVIEGVREFGRDNLEYRIKIKSRDEMGELGDAFNQMAARRKREEDEIQASRARLEYLLTSSPAVIYTSRASGDFGATFISENIRTQMGYEPAQFLEDSGFWADHVHPDDKSRIFDQLPRLFEQGRHIHEYRFLTGKGHYRWMHDELMLVRDASGNPLEIVGCWLNIHGRKQVEETLKESEERFRSFFDMAAIGMVMGNTDGCLVQVNGVFCEIVGYDEKALIGRPFQSLVHPKDLEEELPHLTRLLEGEISHYHREERLIHREGREVWIHVSVSLARDKDGGPVNLIASIENITELRQHRAHLEQLVEDRTAELTRSNQELQQFAYVASHDLQEPLRKVQAFGGRFVALYEDQVDEKGRDYLARMQGAGRRMGTMIQDLLSLSRVTTQGKNFVPVDLKIEAQNVLSDLEVAIDECGGLFEIGDLPTIEGDPLQVRQLLLNLFSNAFKYHKPGTSPLLRIYAIMDESPKGPLCHIHVEDDGIGFEEKYTDRIFEPFQRLHGRSKYEGTGIGLAICRKIAERHGGSITAQSTPGQGATFIVTLPARQP